MKTIQKIKLFNFKRFNNCEIRLQAGVNMLVGDNESGKSTILSAIDLVLSGSRTKVEAAGLESLFNTLVISTFLESNKTVEKMPELHVELYFEDTEEILLNGKNNSEDRVCDGLKMVCKPREDLGEEIKLVLEQDGDNFPFEYYSIDFKTFSGQSYSGNRRFSNYVLIDSSQINNEYATRDYIKKIYQSNTDPKDRYRFQNEYRKHKRQFRDEVLSSVNDELKGHAFAIRTNSKANVESDLTLLEDDIPIESRGKGRQCAIKTEFALNRKGKQDDLDFILLEEPENHLSHISMRRLIQQIADASGNQIIIATHSNLVCMRLDLRKAVLLNSTSQHATYFNALPESTAEFFMKAPGNNVLDFVLSRKCILVEGDAEYILFEEFFRKETDCSLESFDVNCIAVGGIRFKRYLDIAKLLSIKVAVLRDNDGDSQSNCIDAYSDYAGDNIRVFYDSLNDRRTFEVSLYHVNKDLCDSVFSAGRRTLSVQEYMLQNKAETAFELMSKHSGNLCAPDYIKQAITWIKD